MEGLSQTLFVIISSEPRKMRVDVLHSLLDTGRWCITIEAKESGNMFAYLIIGHVLYTLCTAVLGM